jgi:hypothetical protein
VAGRLTSAGRFAMSATAATGIVPPLAEGMHPEAFPEVRCCVGHSVCVGPLDGLATLCKRRPPEIDNKTVERALRAVALGRKNYLFQGSDAGGEYAAAMYSLIGAAKLK